MQTITKGIQLDEVCINTPDNILKLKTTYYQNMVKASPKGIEGALLPSKI